MERNLLKDAAKAKLYDNAIMEYEKNGWARSLSKEDLKANVKPVHYLPHHGIYRPDKKSTPLRIVFDPACQYQGVSLNSFLHKDPCLIGNLLGVCFALEKSLLPSCGKSQRCTYKFSYRGRHARPSVPLEKPGAYKEAHHLRPTKSADKPSPDMASFVMLKMAKDNEKDNPHAAAILRRDRYMDDSIHSCPTTKEAVQRIKELDRVLDTGSFKIKEWISSSEIVLNDLSQVSLKKPDEEKSVESTAVPTAVHLDREKGVKTLGVGWNPQTDVISFKVKEPNVAKLTKRVVVSNISRLYDPLGLASAVTIKARIALQHIWRAKNFDWGDPLPDETRVRWQALFKEIQGLQTL